MNAAQRFAAQQAALAVLFALDDLEQIAADLGAERILRAASLAHRALDAATHRGPTDGKR